MTNQSTRRRFLTTGAVVTGVALAGCTGTGDDDPEPEPEPTDDGDDPEPELTADDAVERVYSVDQLRTNCGTIAHPDSDKFYLTAGAPSNREPDGVGEWYVLDTDSHLPIDPASGETVEDDDFETLDVARDLEGYDTHGFWFVENDGERELWLLNRETDDGVVIDPETDEVIDEIDDYGPAPDIMWASPDDEYMFVTLRGPEPQSGDPHAAEGETPGVSVLDIETREIVTTLEPDEGNPDSDFHGIGVVNHENDDYEIWALDQGTDIIYIYEPADEEDEFDLVNEIDLHETEGVIEASDYVPHMADFSSDYEYAVIACTAGGQTLVFDVENHELVEALDTGPSSHFAGFTPDDEQILVDVIGDGAIQQILVDLDEEAFELGETIEILETSAVADHDDEIESANPICHDHAGDFSYHTLGPGVDDSGLVVLNWAALGDLA